MCVIQGFFEVFAEGESMSDLCRELRTLSPAALAPYCNTTWKMVVDAWGAVYSAEVGLALIDQLDFLPLHGKVQMVDPDVKFWLIVVDTQRGPGGLPEVGFKPYRTVGAAQCCAVARGCEGTARSGSCRFHPWHVRWSCVVAAWCFGGEPTLQGTLLHILERAPQQYTLAAMRTHHPLNQSSPQAATQLT